MVRINLLYDCKVGLAITWHGWNLDTAVQQRAEANTDVAIEMLRLGGDNAREVQVRRRLWLGGPKDFPEKAWRDRDALQHLATTLIPVFETRPPAHVIRRSACPPAAYPANCAIATENGVICSPEWIRRAPFPRKYTFVHRQGAIDICTPRPLEAAHAPLGLLFFGLAIPEISDISRKLGSAAPSFRILKGRECHPSLVIGLDPRSRIFFLYSLVWQHAPWSRPGFSRAPKDPR